MNRDFSKLCTLTFIAATLATTASHVSAQDISGINHDAEYYVLESQLGD